MKATYVCHGPISQHANFLVNRFVGTVILLVKICKWGKGEGAKNCYLETTLRVDF